MLAVLLPPWGSPTIPSQWYGAVSLSPAWAWSGEVVFDRNPQHRIWGIEHPDELVVCPSAWQLEQEKVPVVEVRADSNKCHPCLSVSGLGSCNAIV